MIITFRLNESIKLRRNSSNLKIQRMFIAKRRFLLIIYLTIGTSLLY